MSINVTVSGNPVRINRGRMVTNDPKVEIQKRRRMRLEQVRSQSKDIAENIRNKVRKEKSRQETEFEKDSSSKLKEWQNKKLLQLQDEYVESVKEIGMGHSQAVLEEADEQEFIEERSNIINITAKVRGDVAYEKQQIQNNEKILKATVPKQTKKMVRDVENARAAMVSKMSKSGGKSAVHSHTEDDVTDIIIDVSPSSSTSARSRSPIKSPKKIIPKSSSPTKIIPKPSSPPKNISKSTSSNKSNDRPITSVSQDSSSDSLTLQNLAVPPADTRISDRIKHRHNFENKAVSAVIERPYSPDKSKKRVSNKENINRSPEASTAKIRKEEHACTCNCQVHRTVPVVQSCKCATTCQEIPSKPTMSIRTQNDQSSNTREFNKVQYYDHDNRFSKDCIMDNSNVHKISEESIEMCPSDRSESLFEEVVSRREQEAAERGKRAFERERIQKDMDNLMKKLPVLQKQERIASLDPTKDKFHMNDDRLKEFEQSRQRKIESAFEKLVPNTITISPKNRNKTIRHPSVQEESPSAINVGAYSNYDEDKTSDELKALLEKLKYQKDMLLQETDELPANSNLANLLSKLVAKRSKHRKSSSSSSSSDSPKKKRHKSKDKPDRKVQSNTGTRRNKRLNKNVLVLQNMSTQTSPKVGTRNSPEIPPVQPMAVSKSIDEVDADKVCEIVIKIQDNSKPEISVSSPKKSVQIGVEGPTDNEDQIEQEIAKVTIADTNKSKRKKEIDLKIRKTSDSWKQTLAKDTSNSSTSYYSPPDFTRQNSLLNKQPQQSNISTTRPNKAIDPKLMNYIKKLLQMSKAGVDDLGVSTVSDVSTPGSSVVNVEANNPAQKLISLLKMFNLNLEDVAENISQSGNDSRDYSTADVDRVSRLEGINNASTSNRGSRVSNVNRSRISHDASRMQRSTDNANRNNSSRVPYNTSNRTTVQDVSRASNNVRNNSSRASGVQNNASNRMMFEDVNGASNNIGNHSRRISSVQNNASNRMTLEDVNEALNYIANNSRRPSTVQNNASNRMTFEDVGGASNNVVNNSRRASTVQNNASTRMTLEDVSRASNMVNSVHNNAFNRMTLEDASRPSNNFSRSHYDSRISAPGPSSHQDTIRASRQQGFYIEPGMGQIGNDTRDSGGVSGYEANQNQTVNSINQSIVSNRLTHSNISGDVRNVTLDEYADANYPDVIAHKYSQLANMCQQRIQNLADMIEQVRSEKQQILSPGSNSSDMAANHTGYIGLPPSDEINSPNTEAIQRELTKQLTAVDVETFVDNGQLVNKITDILSRSNEDSSVDPDLMERYLKLITSPTDNPVYLDIPKLPKLQSQQVDQQQNGKKRPPPLQRKYNDKVQLNPHELSTIPEADSIRRSKSPEAHRSQYNSPPKEIVNELIRASRVSPNKSKSSPKNQSQTNNSRGPSTSQTQQAPPSQLPQSSNQKEPQPGPSAPQTCSPKQLQQIIQTLQDISTDTSSDKSEVDVEAMLIDMGMGWAVATLRKTKKTLERQSSSSSMSVPNQSCNEKNITTSTSKSNISASPFFKDFEDISAISACGKPRTSTPVQQPSTSTDRSKSPPVQQANTSSDRSRTQPLQQPDTCTNRSGSQLVQQTNTSTDRSKSQPVQQINTSNDRSKSQSVQQPNTSNDRSRSQTVQQTNTSNDRSRSQPVQQANTSNDRSKSQPVQQANTSNDRSKSQPVQQANTSNDRSKSQPVEQLHTNNDRSRPQPVQQTNTSTDRSRSQSVHKSNTSTDRSRSQPVQQPNKSTDMSRSQPGQQPNTSNDRSRSQQGQQPNTSTAKSKSPHVVPNDNNSRSSGQDIMEDSDKTGFMSFGAAMDGDDSN